MHDTFPSRIMRDGGLIARWHDMCLLYFRYITRNLPSLLPLSVGILALGREVIDFQ